MSPVDSYIERNMSYDLNGNILSLRRYASGQVVNDFAYSYDANGNMTYDGANDLSLSYNHLDLIEKVSRNGVVLANYSYLADGTKLSALDNDGNGLVYAGSLVYRKQNGVMSLESGAFPEGRFVATSGSVGSGSGGSGSSGAGNGFAVHYHLTDHLGSVRAVVDGATGEVVETNDYYSFGMRWQDPNQPVSDNRYRYNAKEEQNFLNLPYIDYGWRQYDAKHGRWFGHDGASELYYGSTPYGFVRNNPISRIDPNGMWDEEFDGGPNEGPDDSFSIWDLFNMMFAKVRDVTTVIDITGNSPQELTQATQRYEQNLQALETATQAVNTVATGATMMIPGGEVISTTVKIATGQEVTGGDVVFAALEFLPFVGQFKDGTKVAKGAYSVYRGLDAAGEVKYVGITNREVAVRAAEHARSGTARAALRYETAATGLTKTEARIMEQTLINEKGLPNLYNVRNSIAPQYWEMYGIKP